MDRLFSIDGWLYRIGKLLIDLIYMNILWLLFTLVGCGITMGASTVALFHVMQRRIDDRGNCSMKDFFIAFKRNFVPATIVGNIVLVIVSIMAFNINNIAFLTEMLGNSMIGLFVLALQFLFIIEVAILSIYVFHLLAMYDVTLLGALRIAMVLGHKHLFASITSVALLAILIVGFMAVPIIFGIGVSTYALLSAYILKEKLKRIN